jgi:hypothetical protein
MGRSDQRGLETLEFVGLFPLVLLTILIVWQFMLVGYAAIVAAGVAREGARAAAIGHSPHSAVEEACPPGLRCRVDDFYRGPGDMRTVVAEVQVPKVGLPFIDNIEYPWVQSTARMRYEGTRQ